MTLPIRVPSLRRILVLLVVLAAVMTAGVLNVTARAAGGDDPPIDVENAVPAEPLSDQGSVYLPPDDTPALVQLQNG